MKQVLQNLKDGSTEVADVACPRAGRGQLLIRTRCSLVSAGTERMLVDFGRAGLIDKARQQPEKVRQVLEKIRTDGLLPTVEAIRNKLDQPLPMGYCNSGVVVDVGSGVTGFAIGDRVSSNGKHAEFVNVFSNLCAKVPAEVSDEDAAFTVLAAIALQGIRLVQPTLGESVVVTGLGLIGLLTVQLLRAHGCRVLGLDFDTRRLQLARQFGAETVDMQAGEDPVPAAMAFSRGRGVDAVIITASTSSSEPVHQAAVMSRKRGRIVLVGVAGLELSRADFYEKELSFQVSCSYGPGRYDSAYEEKGQDYPVGFVRWTEQRNFEAVLDMLASGRLDVKPLISHRFRIDSAAHAYEVVAGTASSLGILLTYDQIDLPTESRASKIVAVASGIRRPMARKGAVVGFIGAGNYANAVLMPAFSSAGAGLMTVASEGGVSGSYSARKFGFERATTDIDVVLSDARINTVVIATRHNTHAAYSLAAKSAGKHVFVEKPLCLTLEDLERVRAAYSDESSLLMVGFNRRFAPHVQKIKALLASTVEPKALVMTVNAGAIPASHWVQDREVGGGRVVGECCHFVDLLRYIVAAPIVNHQVAALPKVTRDTTSLTLNFADGSIGTIHYLANGSKAFPKERLEVFVSGRVLQLDNFRRLTGFGWPRFRNMRLFRQDKGQRACVQAFVDAVSAGTAAPIPIEEILEVSRVSIELEHALR